MYQTEIRFPGADSQIVATAGTAAAHSKAVRAVVDAGYAAQLAAREKAVEEAKAEYSALDALITYGLDKTPEQRAADDRNRKLRSAARNRLADAQLRLSTKEIQRLKAHPVSAPWCGTPAQARRAAQKPNPIPQAATKAYEAGSWVRWNDPLDQSLRFGVVVEWFPGAPALPKNGRIVIPNDGGDAVVISPGFARTLAKPDWQVYGPTQSHPTIETHTGCRVAPALAQDVLFDVAA